MSYDTDQLTRRCKDEIAAAGATTERCKFRNFMAIRLKKVHATVVIAGTSTAHGYNVFHGTTSIGAIALGTSTAGVTASSALLDENVESMEQVSVKSLADAVGSAHIVYEYESQPDAVVS